jgi:hypothetical protein
LGAAARTGKAIHGGEFFREFFSAAWKNSTASIAFKKRSDN